MNIAIEFKNIKKAYGNKVILDGFHLSVAQGEFVTIIGSSGCGKTTALKMINGLIEPTSGDFCRRRKYSREKHDGIPP